MSYIFFCSNGKSRWPTWCPTSRLTHCAYLNEWNNSFFFFFIDKVIIDNRQRTAQKRRGRKMWMINIKQTNCDLYECDASMVRMRFTKYFYISVISRTECAWTCCGFGNDGNDATRLKWAEKWSACGLMESEVRRIKKNMKEKKKFFECENTAVYWKSSPALSARCPHSCTIFLFFERAKINLISLGMTKMTLWFGWDD